jgi:hypothetical protein
MPLAKLGFELGFSDETAASRFMRLKMPVRTPAGKKVRP